MTFQIAQVMILLMMNLLNKQQIKLKIKLVVQVICRLNNPFKHILKILEYLP